MQDKLDKNFKKGRNYITISYFLGAMLFLFAYIHQTELWLLIVAIILLIATVVAVFIFNNLKSLFFKSDDDDDDEDEEDEDDDDEPETFQTRNKSDNAPRAYDKVYVPEDHDAQINAAEKFTPLAVTAIQTKTVQKPKPEVTVRKDIKLEKSDEVTPKEAKPFDTKYEYNSDKDEKIKKTDDEKDDIDNYY